MLFELIALLFVIDICSRLINYCVLLLSYKAKVFGEATDTFFFSAVMTIVVKRRID